MRLGENLDRRRKYFEGDVVNDITLLKFKGGRRWDVEYKCGHIGETSIPCVRRRKTSLCGPCARVMPTSVTHGMTGTREFRIWSGMKQRCHDPNCKDFPSYGGKGITVCEEWLNSFESFYEYVGDCPDGMSIDRVDRNGNYEPGNVRWATASVQNHNRGMLRNNKSGKKGVFQLKSGEGWQAAIMVNRVKIHLGTFQTFEEARKAREDAELKYLGEVRDV